MRLLNIESLLQRESPILEDFIGPFQDTLSYRILGEIAAYGRQAEHLGLTKE
jgi:hypothetical protein